VAANDNPMTPAPAYKSATADSYGTYFCNFRSKVSKAWKNEEARQEAYQINLYRLNGTENLNNTTTLDILYMVIAKSANFLTFSHMASDSPIQEASPRQKNSSTLSLTRLLKLSNFSTYC